MSSYVATAFVNSFAKYENLWTIGWDLKSKRNGQYQRWIAYTGIQSESVNPLWQYCMLSVLWRFLADVTLAPRFRSVVRGDFVTTVYNIASFLWNHKRTSTFQANVFVLPKQSRLRIRNITLPAIPSQWLWFWFWRSLLQEEDENNRSLSYVPGIFRASFSDFLAGHKWSNGPCLQCAKKSSTISEIFLSGWIWLDLESQIWCGDPHTKPSKKETNEVKNASASSVQFRILARGGGTRSRGIVCRNDSQLHTETKKGLVRAVRMTIL